MSDFDKYVEKAKKVRTINEMDLNFGGGSPEKSGAPEVSDDPKFGEKISNKEYFERSIQYFLRGIRGGKTLANVTGDIIYFIDRILEEEDVKNAVDLKTLVQKLTLMVRSNKGELESDSTMPIDEE